jgi:hypothetical protein
MSKLGLLPPRCRAGLPGVCVCVFFSALLRAITATLSPTLTQEFSLNARDLGLLAGGYFPGLCGDPAAFGHLAGPLWSQESDSGVLVCGGGRLWLFRMATSFSGLLAARVLVWRGGKCLPDGATHRLSPLV